MNAGDTLLIQFARAVEPGVKTRLQPPLDPFLASRLHLAMVRQVRGVLQCSGLGPVQLWLAPGRGDARREAVHEVAHSHLQGEGDLGQRMARALAAGLQRCSRVVLVGSDCVALSTDYLAQAAAVLTSAPVVVGPALDGGYVLIGVNRVCEGIFEDIDWGSDQVLLQTRARLRAQALEWRELPPLGDVDRPQDIGGAHDVLLGRSPYDRCF